jgi:hypothetical protein
MAGNLNLRASVLMTGIGKPLGADLAKLGRRVPNWFHAAPALGLTRA